MITPDRVPPAELRQIRGNIVAQYLEHVESSLWPSWLRDPVSAINFIVSGETNAFRTDKASALTTGEVMSKWAELALRPTTTAKNVLDLARWAAGVAP